ncbi:hypothetical protein EXE43_16070 [Halorubrum sp. SS5]|nr:hypothetical protein EXE43_16070 [Halorubrum sp. SS5]
MNAAKAEMTSELEIRTTIEDQLISELHSVEASDHLDVSLVVPFISVNHEDAVIHIEEFDDQVHIEIFVQNCDLMSLQHDRDGAAYPKSPKSPRPHETEFHEHGELYESYRNLVANAVATDLGLKSDWSLSEAVSEGSEPVFTCQDYVEAHSDSSPDQETRVPYLCAFHKQAFFELD